MTRVLVICEGHTELEFVSNCLEPHLRNHGLVVHPSLLKTRRGMHGGGDVTVERVAQHIRLDYHHFDRITTLLDLYGFRHAAQRDKPTLESAILKAVRHKIPSLRADRVLPHVQRHEFEALLFSDVNGFEWVQDGWSDAARNALNAVRNQYASPEDIDDGPLTAPSKRIQAAFPAGRYNKVVHGPLVAEAIGLHRIRAECPGFNDWVSTMERWGSSGHSLRTKGET